MKTQWYKGWRIATILMAGTALCGAQSYTAPNASSAPATPAPPGTVNYVEGQVSVDGQTLFLQSARSLVLQPNQTIDTVRGYAEVLLTPGAFLRLGNNSEAQLITAGLANTQVSLVRGSAMIEADYVTKSAVLSLATDGATAQIEKRGLYDFDANQRAIKVLDGKAKIEESDHDTTLGKGNEVLLASNKPLRKHDFDVKAAENDPLWAWSNARSEQEAEANQYLAQTVVVNGGWYGPGWYWDPYLDFWGFLPGYGMLYSPFGWGFYSPGLIWGGPYYGYWGHGHWAHGHVVARSGTIHSGMSGFHAAGGFHGGFAGGGFHGGFVGGGRR